MSLAMPTTTTFTSKRILVIDDEHRLADSLAALLRGAGYQVDSATSGPAGLRRLVDEVYDLVVTDLRMDQVSGIDIMRHITEHCPRTAIVIITGHASMESAIEALHQRVSDYIPKPFDLEVLFRSIEKVFAQQETERLKKDLVNMLTHDIKVPLTSVLGFAQLVRAEDGSVDPRAGEFADIIVSNCQKVLMMLDNYLTNARAEDGRLEIIRIPICPAVILEQELNLTSHDLQRKQIKVDKSGVNRSVTLDADEHLITRAMSNLISNAAKYTPNGGTIRISIEADDASVRVLFANSGAILAENDRRRVFHRYERAHSSAGKEGSGLGLHVVRCVAEAHGGRAECLVDGDMLAFEMVLPRVSV